MKGRAAVIIPAAGSGSRMKSEVPKQYMLLRQKPMLVHTVLAFTRCSIINQIIIAVPQTHIVETKNLLQNHHITLDAVTVIPGGRRRQDSVRAGLDVVDAAIDIVLVHDGARPFVSTDLIERCYHETVTSGAAIAAIQSRDTLKRETSNHFVESTLDREGIWQAQTPQAAQKKLLIKAFEENHDKDVTDESTLLEKANIPVRLVAGEQTNIKITTPEDLNLANVIMNSHSPVVRIGHGFDAHRFEKGRELILGGVKIDFGLGLAGHSDADVLTHALCDAILGACGLGDLGRHFPNNDDAFKDISSLILLKKVVSLAAAEKFKLTNADMTIVCQVPKIAPYVKEMRKNIAKCSLTDMACISIKATTTEHMGFTGRKEGMSCHAVVLLEQL